MRKILFIIDMINDFVHPDGKLFFPKYREIIPNIKNLIDEFDKEGNNIFFICDNHDKDDPEYDLFPEHALKGTLGADIIDEFLYIINYEKPQYIEKKTFDGFFNTKLHETINPFDPKDISITVTGVCTSICIMDTVQGAYNRGYGEIIVPENCVADFDRLNHYMALNRMEKLYGAKII